ncbi:MAG: hypothetical protein M5U32_09365 [Myxococcota bacterium]|nr:hypothetical protein [Myxococcota bacterium]
MAVLRARGSTSTRPCGSPDAARIAAAWSAVHTIQIRSGAVICAARASVAASSVAPPATGSSGFGRRRRDCGHSRSPEPPAITTACRSNESSGAQLRPTLS